MSKSLRWATIIFAVWLVAGWQQNLSWAQSPRDPGAVYLKEQQRKRDSERLRNSKAGKKVKIKDPGLVTKEKVCFHIDRIKLHGVTVLQSSILRVALDPYTGSCMGQKAISALVQKITNIYAEKGFITTRVYVPQQDIRNRILKLDVLEGRIAGFAYRVVNEAGKVEPGNPRKIFGAFPISPGDVFQLRDIEQGLDQINRLRSSKAKIDLIPGKVPGTTLVVVTEQVSDRFRGYVGYNNNGSEATGRDRVTVSLEADDVFGVNDEWNLSYAGSENTNVLAFGLSVPYGNWTFSGNGSYSESVSRLTTTSDMFSQTASVSAKVERLILRDSTSKYWGYFALNYYWNNRYINMSQLTPQNRTSVRAGFRQEHHTSTGVISLNTAATLGIPLLGADKDGKNIEKTVPRAEFVKFDATLSYIHRFKAGPQLSSIVSGQYTNHALFSNEQLTIGGWDTVRGYAGADASGEVGLYNRNQLYLPMPDWGSAKNKTSKARNFARHFYQEYKHNVQPYVFLDAGWTRNIASGEKSTMAGIGAGINVTVGRLNMGAVVAIPMTDGHAIVKTGKPQGHVNVALKLF